MNLRVHPTLTISPTVNSSFAARLVSRLNLLGSWNSPAPWAFDLPKPIRSVGPKFDPWIDRPANGPKFGLTTVWHNQDTESRGSK